MALVSGPVATFSPIVGVLAVQGDVREHAHALERCGARAVPVRRRSELDSVQALVIPGGESTVIDKLLRAFDLCEPLRARIAEGMPTFGSCAGMILLADRIADGASDQQTLGGIDMTVRRNAFGRQVDSFEVDLSLSGVTGRNRPDMDAPAAGQDDHQDNDQDDEADQQPFRGVFIRAPRVEQTGPGVQILARLPEAGEIVAVRQGALLATAFHPEVGGDDRLHAHFVALITDR